MRRIVRIAILSSAVAGAIGCATGPASWSRKLKSEVKCGMSVEEVQRLAGREIARPDVAIKGMTHYIRDGSTDVWLVFDGGKLQSIQVAWMYKLKKMKEEPRVDLCRPLP